MVRFSSISHFSTADHCAGSVFTALLQATADELPTDGSASSFVQRDRKITRYPPAPPTEIFSNRRQRGRYYAVYYTHCPAWCPCVMYSQIARRCSVPLYLTAQWAHFTRAAVEERGDAKAFMSRHQEELDSCEIQMGFCRRWLGTIFTLGARLCLQCLKQISSKICEKIYHDAYSAPDSSFLK